MISEDYMEWTAAEYREQLNTNPFAQQQLRNDVEVLESCDVCVLVLPCGRSAHTEAGWFAGRGKKVVAYRHAESDHDIIWRRGVVILNSIKDNNGELCRDDAQEKARAARLILLFQT